MSRVLMRDVETDGLVPVSEAAFAVYQKRSPERYERVEIDHATAEKILRSPIASVESLSNNDLLRLGQRYLALQSATAAELKDEARDLGLPTSGTKDELKDRVLDARSTEPAESGADAPAAGSSSEQPAANRKQRPGGSS